MHARIHLRYTAQFTILSYFPEGGFFSCVFLVLLDLTSRSVLYELKLVEDIGFVSAVAEARAGHVLLYAAVVLLRPALLVSAHRISAEIGEAFVERVLGLFGALRVGLRKKN